MSYNPDSENEGIEFESRVKRPIKHSKMSRKVLHSVFWIVFGIGAIFTYFVMLLMGNPFSPIAGTLITGGALVWVISTILLWWINARTLFFASKWYMRTHWYILNWVSFIVSAIITTGLYFFNMLAGVYVFYVLGGIALIVGVLYGEYRMLASIIKGIEKNTVNDDPVYYDEE